MTPYADSVHTGHTLYDLYAVINHEGSLHQGHYTSHVKRGGEWFRCQDQKVCVVDENTVLSDSSTAYVLFYQQNPH